MESENIPPSIVAEGPEGLTAVLNSLYRNSQIDPEAPFIHYILFRLGNQKSLIRIDLSKAPCHFWYYDLLGRPITQMVKETLNQFLMNKYGTVNSGDVNGL